nr:transposase, mutator type [Tanacetum cinerariifolium]
MTYKIMKFLNEVHKYDLIQLLELRKMIVGKYRHVSRKIALIETIRPKRVYVLPLVLKVNEIRMLSSELNVFSGPLAVQFVEYLKQLSQIEVLRMLELRKMIAETLLHLRTQALSSTGLSSTDCRSRLANLNQKLQENDIKKTTVQGGNPKSVSLVIHHGGGCFTPTPNKDKLANYDEDNKIILVYVEHGSINVDSSIFVTPKKRVAIAVDNHLRNAPIEIDSSPNVNRNFTPMCHRNLTKEWEKGPIVIEIDDPFVDYDEIVCDYANTRNEIIVHVGNSSIVKNVVDCDMLYETKGVGPMGNLKEVNVDTDNKTEDESVESPFPGQILIAVRVDANNGIYPVVYAIVEAERKTSWCWFLNLLGEDLVQKVIAKTFGPLTPTVTGIFDVIRKAATDYIVDWNEGYLYQVIRPYRDQCIVNIDRKVHATYRLETWAHVCSFKINPCNDKEMWLVVESKTIKLAGHQKKRNKSIDELGQGGVSQAGGSGQQSQGARQAVGARNVSSQAAGFIQQSQAPRQVDGVRNVSSEAGGFSQQKKDQYKVLMQRMPQVKLLVLVNLVQHQTKQAKDQLNIV